VKLEERVVHAVDRGATGAAARGLVAGEPLEREQGGARRWRNVERVLKPAQERRRERRLSGDDDAGAADSAGGDGRQAGAHRAADEQRAGHHRDGRRHAQRHGHVCASVVPEAAQCELGERHVAGWS
jgi:hypothetical protein